MLKAISAFPFDDLVAILVVLQHRFDQADLALKTLVKLLVNLLRFRTRVDFLSQAKLEIADDTAKKVNLVEAIIATLARPGTIDCQLWGASVRLLHRRAHVIVYIFGRVLEWVLLDVDLGRFRVLKEVADASSVYRATLAHFDCSGGESNAFRVLLLRWLQIELILLLFLDFGRKLQI